MSRLRVPTTRARSWGTTYRARKKTITRIPTAFAAKAASAPPTPSPPPASTGMKSIMGTIMRSW